MHTFRYCKHRIYGVGSAILIKHRRKPPANLYMVEFQAYKDQGKFFFLEREFSAGDDIEFIDEAEATKLLKKGRTQSFRKKDKNLGDLLDRLL